jgi:hypothetical protein
MGDGIFGHVSKGPVHIKIDALANQRDAKGQFNQRAAFLSALINQANTPEDYLGILQTQAHVTKDQADYLGLRWYGTGKEGFFPQVQPIYPIIRQGLIKALQEAGQDLALDSYWVAVAGDAVFETIIVKSAVQVTRLVMTPISPQTPQTSRTMPAPMWVVKRKKGDEVPGSGPHDELVESIHGDVVTWQRRELR